MEVPSDECGSRIDLVNPSIWVKPYQHHQCDVITFMYQGRIPDKNSLRFLKTRLGRKGKKRPLKIKKSLGEFRTLVDPSEFLEINMYKEPSLTEQVEKEFPHYNKIEIEAEVKQRKITLRSKYPFYVVLLSSLLETSLDQERQAYDYRLLSGGSEFIMLFQNVKAQGLDLGVKPDADFCDVAYSYFTMDYPMRHSLLHDIERHQETYSALYLSAKPVPDTDFLNIHMFKEETLVHEVRKSFPELNEIEIMIRVNILKKQLRHKFPVYKVVRPGMKYRPIEELVVAYGRTCRQMRLFQIVNISEFSNHSGMPEPIRNLLPLTFCFAVVCHSQILI